MADEELIKSVRYFARIGLKPSQLGESAGLLLKEFNRLQDKGLSSSKIDRKLGKFIETSGKYADARVMERHQDILFDLGW